ncbi:hypothetical protein Taro_032742 [Colocasia esculenta]|uniref:Uncharacterized protein n=1 Tax=Colocasia esculenta TaxID=4460 RepID=A0A843WAB9_COLES|nr:hypothetical protein [Colocasia esculenta]
MGHPAPDLISSSKALLLLILLVSPSLLVSTTSFAGMPRKLADRPSERTGAVDKEIPAGKFSHSEEEGGLHHRILKVKTNDYASYDPTPTFVKPPFKTILN